MKKKGFTLIELLAVIVILAIIALIATPIILNIISDSKEESNKRSVELYGKAVENAVAKYQLNNNESISGTFTTTDGKTLTKGEKELKVEYNGNVVCTTTEIYEDGTVYLADCTVNGGDKKYTYGKLIAGLFDENNKLIATWETLEKDYGLDIETDYPEVHISDILIKPEFENVTKITIPDGVTYIGQTAFAYCTNLTSVTIPDSVSYIGLSAFNGCSNLTSVTIPDSVGYIDGGAFNGCSNLTSVTIGNSVTGIGSSAFQGCTSLTSVTIGNSLTSIGEAAFYGTGLTSITIPDSVTEIQGSAFSGCSNLTSVTIGNGVTSIGVEAFEGCTNLTSATFNNPNGWEVYYNGPEQTTIELPELLDPATNATYLSSTHTWSSHWYRS